MPVTKRKSANLDAPIWFDGTNINEALFCDEFLSSRKIIFANGAFFTPDGRVTDDLPLRGEIYEELKCCAVNNMFARLLAFSNGDLQAHYDRSDGFYRRQLVLTTKEKSAGRVDDPDLAEKVKAETDGIFLWAFEGLQRLVANNFKFTESQRTRDNREAVKRDNNWICTGAAIVMAVVRVQPFIQPLIIHDLFNLPQKMVFRHQCLQLHNDWLMPCVLSPVFHKTSPISSIIAETGAFG